MLLLALFLGCSEEEKASPQELYDTYCGLCHGYDGEGYLAPAANALNNPEFLSIASTEFLIYATKFGRSGSKMSAWSEIEGGPLSDQEVEDIVGYIEEWSTLPKKDIDINIEGDSDNGLELYTQHCAVCHGAEGEGASALSLNSPEFLSSVTDGFLYYSLIDGRSNTTMQSYADQFSEEEIFDLVAAIRSWEE